MDNLLREHRPKKSKKIVLSKVLKDSVFYVGDDMYSTDHSCYESVRFASYIGIEASNTGKARFYLRYSVTCPYKRCGSFSHSEHVYSVDASNFTIPWPTSVEFQLEY